MPCIADVDVAQHVAEFHCARFGCGHMHVLDDAVPWPGIGMRSVDWIGLHDSDHALRYADGTSPFGHVHVARVAA